jgi:hypothetical protein
MSDVAGAAPAAAESTPAPVEGAPIADVGASFSHPLGSQIPEEAQAKPGAKAPPSIDDAIDRAAAKSAAKAAEPKVEAKPEPKAEAKTEQPRENGKFVAKDKPADAAKPTDAVKPTDPVEAAKPSHTAEDAPARFAETAKAKWASADPEIRGEVLRMQRELTEGYQKHREKAEKYDAIKDFDDMATKSGTTVKDALARYVGMEQKLRGDLIGGLDEIVANATGGKASLRDVAAHVMGQTPEQAQSQSDATIRELKQTVAQLQQQVGGVVQTVTQQREHSTLQEVTKFADTHPRFEELADDIGFFMKSGRAKDLSEAYQLAERLNPAPAKATAEPAASSAPAAKPDLSVQPDKGQKSINGAPSSGLNSSGKKRVARSLDDALDHAFGQVG